MENSIKFLKSSGSKFWYDINSNGNPAFWLNVNPNAAKSNFSLEFSVSGFTPGIVNYDLGTPTNPFHNLYLNTGVRVNNIQIIGAQQAHINAPSGGTTIDTQARTAISSILTALQTHGLLA
jgi:hypothetical protein